MKNSQGLSSEDIELSTNRIPPRRRLYPLVPIGLETPYTESLTSYITRLADAHCLTTKSLVLRELFPRLDKRYLQRYGPEYLFTFWKTQSPRLNGISNTSEDWVKTIQSMTLCDQLYSLTFLPWRTAIGRRQLLRSTKAWCHVCFDEWKQSGSTLHDSLLWALQAVKICPRHLQVLREVCPDRECGRTQPFLSANARTGYCSYCGGWLGGENDFAESDKIQVKGEALRWQLWVATSIGELISAAAKLSSGFCVSRKRSLTGLAACLAYVEGNSYLRLSEILKVSPNALQSWVRRGSLPNIELLLRLSYSLGVSLKTLLIGDKSFENPHKVMTVPVGIMRASSYTSSRRIKPQILKIRFCLERLSAGGEVPPPSIRQVAKRLGCGDDALRHHFPELCSSIRIRHHKYVQARKRQRRQEIYQQIRNIVSELSNQGSYPSAKRVQGILKATTDFRDRELRETWQRAKKEAGVIVAQKKNPMPERVAKRHESRQNEN